MTATAAPPARRRRSPMVPPQHGAWAFLGLPLAVGYTVTTWTPLLVPMSVAWIAAYPSSYFLLAIAQERSRRRPDPRRFSRPLSIWSAAFVAAAGVTVWFRPWLVWVGLVYLAAFAINLAYASRRDDRALSNGAVFVVECAAMVPVTWAVAWSDGGWTPPAASDVPHQVWVLTAAVALLLAGSTLHVKSLIRERADPRYAKASRVVAVLSVAMAVGLAIWWGLPHGWWLVVPFAYAAVRSFVVRDPGTRPGRIGMVELAGFLLLVVAAILA